MKRLLTLVFSSLLVLASCNKENTKPQPDGSFTYIVSGREVKFTATGTNVSSWSWDFGDGTQGAGQEATHVYDSVKEYTVTLTMTNDAGSKQVTQQVYFKEQVIEIKTSFGTMYMWLYNETPLHKANFLKLAKEGFFDGTTFHRIIQDFMIQGGDPNSKDSDPNNDGTGGPGYTIPAEIQSTLKHVYGAVGAARLGNAQNPTRASSGSQFYIVENAAGTPHLNNEYTVFGYIMKGIDVAVTISKQPKNAKDRPIDDIVMDVNVLEKTRAEILADYGYTVK